MNPGFPLPHTGFCTGDWMFKCPPTRIFSVERLPPHPTYPPRPTPPHPTPTSPRPTPTSPHPTPPHPTPPQPTPTHPTPPHLTPPNSGKVSTLLRRNIWLSLKASQVKDPHRGCSPFLPANRWICSAARTSHKAVLRVAFSISALQQPLGMCQMGGPNIENAP